MSQSFAGSLRLAAILVLTVASSRADAGQTGVIMSVETNNGDVVIAQPESGGSGWVKFRTVGGWRVSGFHPRGGHFDHYWAQFVPLPPGRYGIVSIHWVETTRHVISSSRIVQGGGGTAVYEGAVAQFTVRPNEVVNVGALSLRGKWIYPIPDAEWKEFSAAHPDLAAVAVKRLMTP